MSSSASDPSQEENEYSMHGNSPDLLIIIKIKKKNGEQVKSLRKYKCLNYCTAMG